MSGVLFRWRGDLRLHGQRALPTARGGSTRQRGA